ncbi:hypothetical protein [Pigmentibacter ruber]|uniref:hypothetical protein n=1 Tax=Pigmentibacter ruber TaxID=2683196 RepID=UPI00131D0215|nr:hypothetical protein [Pigmentibacter ruber]
MNCFIFIEISNNFMNIASLNYLKSKNTKIILLCKSILFYSSEITKFCDEIMEINTNQISSLISACNFIEKKDKIVGIMTLDDDFLVQTAELKEYFGHKSTSKKCLEAITNRFKMRSMLKKINQSFNPKFFFAKTLNEALLATSEISFPFIVRPIQRSKYIYSKKITCVKDLKEYFLNNYSKNIYHSWENYYPGLLIEEEIIGNEYSVHFVKSEQGTIILAGVFKRENVLLDDGRFLNITTQFPAEYEESDFLFQKLIHILPKIGFDLGLIQIDCKICNNEVKILNIIPTINQSIANYYVMQKSIGINFSKINIDLNLGLQIEWYPLDLKEIVLYNSEGYNNELVYNDLCEKFKNRKEVEVIKIQRDDCPENYLLTQHSDSLMVVSKSRELSKEVIRLVRSFKKIMKNVS